MGGVNNPPDPRYGQQRQPGYGPPPGYPNRGPGPGPQGPPPQYGRPQQFAGLPQYGPSAVLHINTSFMPLGFFLFFTGPLIVIDGVERGRTWGEEAFEVAPGIHHLHIHTRYMGTLGPIDEQVQVGPGQHVGLAYEAPMWMGGKPKFRYR